MELGSVGKLWILGKGLESGRDFGKGAGSGLGWVGKGLEVGNSRNLGMLGMMGSWVFWECFKSQNSRIKPGMLLMEFQSQR